MYLIDVKKLYFYAVSFISFLALAFSLLGGVSSLARYYWFKTGPLISYQPAFISTWVPWNSLMVSSYANPDDPYNLKMEKESINVSATLTSFADMDPGTKETLKSWEDSYVSWKNEQTNLKRSMADNIILNLTAFFIFLPIFLFHLKMALKLDDDGVGYANEDLYNSACCDAEDCGDETCACGGACTGDCACGGIGEELEFCSEDCECGGKCMCGECTTDACKCECHK